MNTSPFTTQELKELPRNAYAYRNRFGVWGIRQDVETVNQVVRKHNEIALTPSAYYVRPIDALVVAEIVTRSFTVAQHIDKAYNG